MYDGSNVNFRFGIDSSGNYGYKKAGADTVTPFKTVPTGNKSITIDSVGTTSDIDVSNYATASVTTSGLSKPSGTKYIYSNGTYSVTDYASAYVSVSASLSRTTLWTNNNPGSSSSIASFNAQNVSLSYSLASYTYIEFVWKAAGSNSSEYQSTSLSTIYKSSDIRGVTGSGTQHSYFFYIGGYRWNARFARPFYYVDNYIIHFQDGMNVQSGASDNKTMIPLYIYGLS